MGREGDIERLRDVMDELLMVFLRRGSGMGIDLYSSHSVSFPAGKKIHVVMHKRLFVQQRISLDAPCSGLLRDLRIKVSSALCECLQEE